MDETKVQLKSFIVNFATLICLLLPCNAALASVLMGEDEHSTVQLFDSSISYYTGGAYLQSVNCLNRIRIIKDTINTDIFPEYYKLYNLYGVVYKKMGLLAKAEEYYSKTLLYSLPQMHRAKIQMNLGNIYAARGGYNTALMYYDKVKALISGADNDSQRLLANAYYNMGKAYDNSTQDMQALHYFLLSLQVRKEAKLSEDAETLLSCAISYNKTGSKDTANSYYNRAIAVFEQDQGRQHYSTALAYMNYGAFLVESQKYPQGLKLYTKSLNILLKTVGHKHLYTSFCFRNMGELHSQLGNYKKSLTYFQKALIAKVYNFNDTAIYANPKPSANTIADINVLTILRLKALALEKLADTENKNTNLLAALNTLKLSTTLIEQLREGYLYESTKLKLTENANITYLAVIRLAHKLYTLTQNPKYANIAFNYAGKSKYAVLSELYTLGEIVNMASLPDSLQHNLKASRKKLSEIRWQIENETNSPKPNLTKLNSLKDQLFAEARYLEKLSAELHKRLPENASLKNNTQTEAVSEFQAILRKDQVAFDYTLLDSSLYTFVVTKTSFEFVKTQLDSVFYQNLNYYKAFLTSLDWHNYDSFRLAAYALYQTLLQPYEKQIENKSLLIIPDKEFAQMAFESLLDEPYKKNPLPHYAHQPYIIRKYPIGYAFSSNWYVEALKKTSKGRNRVLAIAPTYKILEDSTLTLTYLERHLRRISFFNGTFYDKEDASETALKKHIADYNIIHIYAHGNEDPNHPSNSCIMLDNANNPADDGNLYAHEISNLSLNAKLVILASCYSGSGKLSGGEGVLSVGRSFSGAGAPSLILSLWYNYLEVSVEQIATFNKHLLLGQRKDKALQIAKLNYLENANEIAAHPKEWASLVLMGNQEPLYHYVLLKVLALLAGAVVLIYLGFRFLRQRRRI